MVSWLGGEQLSRAINGRPPVWRSAACGSGFAAHRSTDTGSVANTRSADTSLTSHAIGCG
jgi:hypothetical protein